MVFLSLAISRDWASICASLPRPRSQDNATPATKPETTGASLVASSNAPATVAPAESSRFASPSTTDARTSTVASPTALATLPDALSRPRVLETSPATLPTFFASSASSPDWARFLTSSSAAFADDSAAALSSAAVLPDVALSSLTPGSFDHSSMALPRSPPSVAATAAMRAGSDSTSAVFAADCCTLPSLMPLASAQAASPAAAPASAVTFAAVSPASLSAFCVAGSSRNFEVTSAPAAAAAAVSDTAFSRALAISSFCAAVVSAADAVSTTAKAARPPAPARRLRRDDCGCCNGRDVCEICSGLNAAAVAANKARL
mmetsp:Transcript_14821/g.51168  ORF Transcript_14821/g.51168 Transcript_14821/m.51168 type:complete len:318 (+) Transcript_14821:1918-2871(+)